MGSCESFLVKNFAGFFRRNHSFTGSSSPSWGPLQFPPPRWGPPPMGAVPEGLPRSAPGPRLLASARLGWLCFRLSAGFLGVRLDSASEFAWILLDFDLIMVGFPLDFGFGSIWLDSGLV